MKVLLVSGTAYVIYLMRKKKPFCTTYDLQGDSFPHLKYIPAAALVLTCIIHKGLSPMQFLWSYSLWLESLAFIPQIIMLNSSQIVENISSHYMACLGMYRFFYILTWVQRWQTKGDYCMTQILSGVLQTALYLDFLYWYVQAHRQGKSCVELPI